MGAFLIEAVKWVRGSGKGPQTGDPDTSTAVRCRLSSKADRHEKAVVKGARWKHQDFLFEKVVVDGKNLDLWLVSSSMKQLVNISVTAYHIFLLPSRQQVEVLNNIPWKIGSDAKRYWAQGE
jgi:hypothetical protein